jgi:hypothetical protein
MRLGTAKTARESAKSPDSLDSKLAPDDQSRFPGLTGRSSRLPETRARGQRNGQSFARYARRAFTDSGQIHYSNVKTILALPNPDASICLLDDDPSVLKGLSRLLRSAGLHAEQFSNPEKFLLYAKTHRTPVAVIDIWMPLMNRSGSSIATSRALAVNARHHLHRKRQPADSFQDIEGRGDSFLHQTFRRRGISHHRSPRAFWNMIWDIIVAPKHRRLR